MNHPAMAILNHVVGVTRQAAGLGDAWREHVLPGLVFGACIRPALRALFALPTPSASIDAAVGGLDAALVARLAGALAPAIRAGRPEMMAGCAA